MRLLYVIDSLAPGGAETSLVEMTPSLIAGGIELHVLPLGRRLDLSARLQQAGAVVHERRTRDGRLGNIQAVMRVAGRISPDLVHTTLYEADVAGRTAARALRIPSSTSIVNDSYGPSHYAESSTATLHAARTLDALTASFATSFHAISTAIAQSVPPRIGISTSRVCVIPRGRDPGAYPFRDAKIRATTRQQLGLADDTKVIIAVGRHEPQKGLHHLLHALPAVSRAHPNSIVLLAGKDGRSSSLLQRIAAEGHLKVRFLGHREDIPALLSAADVFCFPSEREGFGGVLIEAMAVGCPIVASSIPTTREVLGTRTTLDGLLTPVGDTDRLASALSEILDNDRESTLLAERARISFEKRFSINHVTRDMVRFYQSAID